MSFSLTQNGLELPKSPDFQTERFMSVVPSLFESASTKSSIHHSLGDSQIILFPWTIFNLRYIALAKRIVINHTPANFIELVCGFIPLKNRIFGKRITETC